MELLVTSPKIGSRGSSKSRCKHILPEEFSNLVGVTNSNVPSITIILISSVQKYSFWCNLIIRYEVLIRINEHENSKMVNRPAVDVQLFIFQLVIMNCMDVRPELGSPTRSKHWRSSANNFGEIIYAGIYSNENGPPPCIVRNQACQNALA
jgi:hypothetical protein